MTLKITPADVGRKVIDGRGNVETILGVNLEHKFPVETNEADYNLSGVCDLDGEPLYDLVAFADTVFVVINTSRGNELVNIFREKKHAEWWADNSQTDDVFDIQERRVTTVTKILDTEGEAIS